MTMRSRQSTRHFIGRTSIIPLIAVGCIGCRGREASESDEATRTRAVARADTMNAASVSVTFTAAQISHGGVEWAVPEMTAISSVVEVPGQLVINQDRSAALAAPAQGRVLAVHVSPGQRVSRGTALVTLQSPDANMALADVSKANAEVSSRRAGAVYARTARDRAERLLTLKAIPKQDYERAVADDELARASLKQAEAELARARSSAQQLGVDLGAGSMSVRSPIAGVVTTRDAVPGAVVSAGAPLVTVTDPSSLWLSVALPEQAAGDVRLGAVLRFSVAADSADTLTARVQSVSATFDPATRTLPVRGLVLNPGGRLRPEMFARVWLQGRSAQMLSVVPDAAIQRIEGKPVVFVAYPDASGGARFEKRDVQLGPSSADHIAILSGVSPGEMIVVRGAVAVKAELLKGGVPMEMDE
jgi:cobalt-zinc-cadmium efflux system membrane fusion protein